MAGSDTQETRLHSKVTAKYLTIDASTSCGCWGSGGSGLVTGGHSSSRHSGGRKAAGWGFGRQSEQLQWERHAHWLQTNKHNINNVRSQLNDSVQDDL